ALLGTVVEAGDTQRGHIESDSADHAIVRFLCLVSPLRREPTFYRATDLIMVIKEGHESVAPPVHIVVGVLLPLTVDKHTEVGAGRDIATDHAAYRFRCLVDAQCGIESGLAHHPVHMLPAARDLT